MLEKIDRAYNLFFCFQTLCLIAGSLVVMLTPPGSAYVFIIFAQAAAAIVFG